MSAENDELVNATVAAAEASIKVACVWTIRDGLIARAGFYFDRDDAMKAVGASREDCPGAPAFSRRGAPACPARS